MSTGNLVAPSGSVSPATKVSAPAGVQFRRNVSGPILPGSSTSLQISTGNKFRFIGIRLQYTLVQPGTPVAITPSNILAGDEFGLIQSVILSTTDNDYIVNAKALELIKVWGRLNPHHKPVLPALKNAGTTSPVIDSTIVIPFWLLKYFDPVETSLNTKALLPGQLNMTINWGTVANVTSIAGASLGGAMTVELRTLENYGGTVPVKDFRINRIPLLNVAAGASRITTDIPFASNLSYVGFITHEYVTSTGLDSPGILSQFRMKNGEFYFYDCPPNVMRQICMQQADHFLGYSGDAYSNGELIDYSSQTSDDAWTYTPICWDGYETEALSTGGKSGLKFEYDIASTAPSGAAVDVYGLQILTA